MRRRGWTLGLAVVVSVAAVATGARAEDIEKKIRFGASFGANMPVDKIHSSSANSRALFDQNNVLIDFISDPRNDSAAISDFGVRAQYGTAPVRIVEVELPGKVVWVGDTPSRGEIARPARG